MQDKKLTAEKGTKKTSKKDESFDDAASFTSERYNTKSIITVEEYRKILNDHSTSDEIILKRINYLHGFCRNIIKLELENYGK